MAPYRYKHDPPHRSAGRRGRRRRSRSFDEESLMGLVDSKRFSSDSLPSRYSQSSNIDPFADLEGLSTVKDEFNEDKGKGSKIKKEDKSAPLAATDQANSDTFNSIVRPPVLSKNLLIGWRVSIILPFLAAGCLLYLLTCSAPSWRSDWSVVKVKLEQNEWTPIYQHGKVLSGGDGGSGEGNVEVADEEGDVTEESEGGSGNGSGGWLSVNMWGWCLQDAAAKETVCSGENMWFDLDELLGKESKSSAPSGDDFNFLLTHGLVIHGFGMLAAMMALVPIGLNTFRTVRAKDGTVYSSWFEHGTILVACALCLASYIVDRCLKSSVASNLEGHTVTSGLANTVTGVSALLLAVCFLLSGIPPLHFHMKRQRQLLRYWRYFEDYDQAISREAHTQTDDTEKRKGGRSKRSKAYRMTRMILGYNDDDDPIDAGLNEEEGNGRGRRGGGLRRRGTISRWRSRRRERRDERHRRRSRAVNYGYEDSKPKRRGTITGIGAEDTEAGGDRVRIG
ncbi:hypothetical protein IAT40_004769 [Kwoniella sp. CBS 6097]